MYEKLHSSSRYTDTCKQNVQYQPNPKPNPPPPTPPHPHSTPEKGGSKLYNDPQR